MTIEGSLVQRGPGIWVDGTLAVVVLTRRRDRSAEARRKKPAVSSSLDTARKSQTQARGWESATMNDDRKKDHEECADASETD